MTIFQKRYSGPAILPVLLLSGMILAGTAGTALAVTVDTSSFDQSFTGIGEVMTMVRGHQYAGLLSAYPFFINILAIHYGYLFWPFSLFLALLLQTWSINHFPDPSVTPQDAFYWFNLVFACCMITAVAPFLIGIAYAATALSSTSLVWIILSGAALSLVVIFHNPDDTEYSFFNIGMGVVSLLVLLAQPFFLAMITAGGIACILATLLCVALFLVLIALPPFHGKWVKARTNARYFYCPRCLRRTLILDPHLSPLVRWSGRILFKEKKMKHERFEEYYSCATCSGKLLKNVRTMVAVIGGGLETVVQQKNRAYISIWSEKKKQAINGDFDMLEIRNKPGISYAHAINAFINAMKNDLGNGSGKLKSIPVCLVENPPVPEESMRLLRTNFKTVYKY